MNHKLWLIIYESLFMNYKKLTILSLCPVKVQEKLFKFFLSGTVDNFVTFFVVWWRYRVGVKIKSINWKWTASSGCDLILILDWLPLKLSFPDFRLTLNNETDQRKWILILSGKKKGWPKPIWVKPFDPTKLGQRKTSENVKGFLNGKGLTDQTWSVLIQNDPLRPVYWARPGSAKNSLKIFIKTYAFMDTMFVPYLKLDFIFHFLW